MVGRDDQARGLVGVNSVFHIVERLEVQKRVLRFLKTSTMALIPRKEEWSSGQLAAVAWKCLVLSRYYTNLGQFFGKQAVYLGERHGFTTSAGVHRDTPAEAWILLDKTYDHEVNPADRIHTQAK